jgi:dolichol-phosphate mannosyltransferase
MSSLSKASVVQRTTERVGSTFRQPLLPPYESRSVTVVIPCLNEEGNLAPLFESIYSAFQSLGYILPVLVINDGSTDRTPEILAKLTQQYSFLRVVSHTYRKGVAAVWKTALLQVESDWILWGQADMESHPDEDIPLLINACVPGVDGVAGWRQGRGDGKIFASTFANTACRLVFGTKLNDMNWIKIVRRDLLLNLPIEFITHRYLLAVLVGQGHNITQVPTLWHPRLSGKSKFGKKRLIASAVDFARVLLWFFFLRPLNAFRQFRRVVQF